MDEGRTLITPATGHMPVYNYIPNRGYGKVLCVADDSLPHTTPLVDEDERVKDDNEDYDDLFEEEELEEQMEDIDWDTSANDLTKSYNRQRSLHSTAATTPRTNPQKPTANTR